MSFSNMAEQEQQTQLPPKRECGLHSSGKRVNFARKVVHELVGWQPYERHTMDLIKIERRRAARQFLKKRLGTHRRAIKKLTRLEEVVQEESLHHHQQ